MYIQRITNLRLIPMPCARVFVKATFLSTKAGKPPSVVIDRPDDITELVGDIDVKGYDLLIYHIAEIVKNKDNEFWFQKDSNHSYHFDEFAYKWRHLQT